MDHTKPFSKGGKKLALAHRDCNRMKASGSLREIQERLGIKTKKKRKKRKKRKKKRRPARRKEYYIEPITGRRIPKGYYIEPITGRIRKKRKKSPFDLF